MVKRYLETLRKEEALNRMLEAVVPLDAEERVPTEAAVGRITSRVVKALISNPPFTCSAMDGYAVDFENTLAADVYNPVRLTPGTDVFRVNTGDPLPLRTNAVIMIEEVEENEGRVLIRKPASLWQHVRMVGEDVVQGDLLLPTNHTIRVFDVGLLIGAGVREVYVRKKPRLLIIPTGHELIDIGQEPLPAVMQGRLIDFNSYTLVAMAREVGFDPEKGQIVKDKKSLLSILNKASKEYDVIIINAGSSAGTEDFTASVIEELGTLIFHGVAMMPGKPTLFGMVGGKPVFGIPGYPVSTVLAFTTFLGPLCEKLCRQVRAVKHVECITPYKLASSIGVEEVLRVHLIKRHGTYYAYPLARGASVFSSLAKADALVRVPPNVEGYAEGERVSCELLRDETELSGRLHIIGSHDLSLDVLRDLIKKSAPDMDLVSTHVGSQSGIIAMKKGVVDMVTTHILDEREKVYNIPAVKRYLNTRAVALINVVRRTQGLVVAKGNPKAIKGVADLVRKDIRFVNRQVGSGTRVLLDSLLDEHSIDKELIQGYDREEATHTAVGVLVSSGVADVGVAIYPIARLFDTDFIPLVEEEYDLLVNRDFMEDPRFKRLMDALTSSEFAERLREFGGYNTEQTGKTKYVNG